MIGHGEVHCGTALVERLIETRSDGKVRYRNGVVMQQDAKELRQWEEQRNGYTGQR